jgi:hypothetical protein
MSSTLYGPLGLWAQIILEIFPDHWEPTAHSSILADFLKDSFVAFASITMISQSPVVDK